jgi:hypothetical protein
VQPLGGARKAQFLGDCDKITNITSAAYDWP